MIKKEEVLPVLYVPMAMLSLALLPLPYSYYGLLKFVVVASASYQLYRSYSEEKKISAKDAPLLILIFVYNPLVSIHLGRPIWTAVNLVTIAFLIFKVKRVTSIKK